MTDAELRERWPDLSTVRRMAEVGLSGCIYDALIAKTGTKAGVDVLLTFNPNDFTRVWPEGRDAVQVP